MLLVRLHNEGPGYQQIISKTVRHCQRLWSFACCVAGFVDDARDAGSGGNECHRRSIGVLISNPEEPTKASIRGLNRWNRALCSLCTVILGLHWGSGIEYSDLRYALNPKP